MRGIRISVGAHFDSLDTDSTETLIRDILLGYSVHDIVTYD